MVLTVWQQRGTQLKDKKSSQSALINIKVTFRHDQNMMKCKTRPGFTCFTVVDSCARGDDDRRPNSRSSWQLSALTGTAFLFRTYISLSASGWSLISDDNKEWRKVCVMNCFPFVYCLLLLSFFFFFLKATSYHIKVYFYTSIHHPM